jgi:hypothetical protein
MIPQNPVGIDDNALKFSAAASWNFFFFGGQLEFDPGLLDYGREAGIDTIKYAGRG